ncbi:hypothetical protein Anas_10678 [Armadillidium nasatum]|uniref:Uncharacterized protein n=1 Tax=Armadillidium nasatum TaxID=96803 RepID=A0A5N5SNE9_9CRUS|nr:hypothetical protein Anas_10678 [Armadillidium nasatum]
MTISLNYLMLRKKRQFGGLSWLTRFCQI